MKKFYRRRFPKKKVNRPKGGIFRLRIGPSGISLKRNRMKAGEAERRRIALAKRNR